MLLHVYAWLKKHTRSRHVKPPSGSKRVMCTQTCTQCGPALGSGVCNEAVAKVYQELEPSAQSVCGLLQTTASAPSAPRASAAGWEGLGRAPRNTIT